MINVLFALAIILGLGVLLLRAGGFPHLSWDLLLGAGFLVGTIMATVAMLILDGVGIAWSPVAATLMSLVLAGSAVLIRKMDAPDEPPESDRPRFSVADILLVFVLVVYARFLTESSPRDLDYWAIWGLKAKVFFAAGGMLDWRFLTDPTNGFAHPDYPPLMPLLYSFLASWEHAWSDRWFGLVDLAFVTAFLLVVRGSVSRVFGSVAVGSWTALLLAFPAMQTRFGIADLPLFALVTSGLLFLQSWAASKDDRHGLLGFVLLGGGALVKNEGLTFLIITIIVMAVTSARLRRIIVISWPGVALAATWQVPRMIAGLATDVTRDGWLSRVLGRISDPSWTLSLLRGMPSTVVAAFVALAVALALSRDHLKRFNLLLVVPLWQLLVYLVVYTGSPHDVVWHVLTSWGRISLHLAVPVLVASVPGLLVVTKSSGVQESGGAPAG